MKKRVRVRGDIQPYQKALPHYEVASHFPLSDTLEPKTLRNMETDRAATNLGPEVDAGISEEPAAVPKQPKRRFVGRKTAEKTGEQQADPNANIEDSSAIQGVRSPG